MYTIYGCNKLFIIIYVMNCWLLCSPSWLKNRLFSTRHLDPTQRQACRKYYRCAILFKYELEEVLSKHTTIKKTFIVVEWILLSIMR